MDFMRSLRRILSLSVRFVVFMGLMVIFCGVQSEGEKSGVRKQWKEEQLVTNLLNGYVKETRPVLKPTDAVSVVVKFSFLRVEDLNEATDTFTSSVFIVQMWQDPRLKWNAADYGGVRIVRLPASKLWIPDLVPYNVAQQAPTQSMYEETVTVTPDGRVVWIPVLKLSSTCPMDLRDFPYDVQTCPLVFGSWMHTSWEMNVTFFSSDKTEMDVILNEEDSSFLVHPHPQWELVDNRIKARLILKKYECCSQPFTLITITVQLRRRPQFFRYLTVAPAAILGILVPIIHLVPSQGHDKTLFGLLLLLCLTILMTIIQQAIPFNHGSLPKICTFYLGTMILTCMSIITSVIVANISVRGARRKAVPSWIHMIFLGRHGLRRYLCIGDYGPLQNLYASDIHIPPQAQAIANNCDSVANNCEDGLQEVEGSHLMQSLDPDSSTDKQTANVAAIHRCTRFIVGKIAADATYHNVHQEWAELGRVIDRCLFVAFFVIYIFTASSLL